MKEPSASLNKLDTTTQSRIRSTQILTSLPQIVTELVQNALDAGATHIDVGVHAGEWTCWVQDDGCGFSRDGLAQIAKGIEGGRYASSKAYEISSLANVETFGFRGEALASAADLSCLEIASRTVRSKETWSILMKGGETLYAGPSLRWRRERAGTTVSVRDAFYNLPIRRLSHSNPSRTIELVRKELESVALVHSHVSFVLQDASKESTAGSGRSRVLTIPKTDSMLSTFRHLYGRALLERIENVDVQSDDMRIHGFLSLVGAHTKSYQFLYVNRHILDHCQLHRVIDDKFSRSTFSKHALDEAGENASTQLGSRRSPRKGERRPVYVLNLSIHSRDVDNCLDPAKRVIQLQNSHDVLDFLTSIIDRFLKRHGFLTATTQKDTENSPTKRLHAGKKRKIDQCSETRADEKLLSRQGPQRSVFFEKQEPNAIYVFESDQEEHAGVISWMDVTSGRTYLVDTRTGNSYLKGSMWEGADSEHKHCPPGRRTLGLTPGIARHSCMERDKGGMPSWIKDALQSNITFGVNESGIRSVRNDASVPSNTNTQMKQGRRLAKDGFKNLNRDSIKRLGDSAEASVGSFSKEALASARVISQVDRKFVACVMTKHSDAYMERTDGHDVLTSELDMTPKASLVLIDQHAADERIRVERYLKSICLGFLDVDGPGIEKRKVDPPVPILLMKSERDRLISSEKLKKALRNWGFGVDDEAACLVDASDNNDYGMVYFKCVPEVVADKLLMNDAENLREMVKGYLARLDSEVADTRVMLTKETLRPGEERDELLWLRALRYCPQELIELVNSRACRGAIMFNDRLSDIQCRRLVRQLACTAFPFQCAHGRPSIVPLTSLDHYGTRVSRGFNASRPIDWQNLGSS